MQKIRTGPESVLIRYGFYIAYSAQVLTGQNVTPVTFQRAWEQTNNWGSCACSAARSCAALRRAAAHMASPV